MLALLRETHAVYNKLFVEYGDNTTKRWFMISNPFYVVILSLMYLYFCTRLGPKLMKDRKPFDLRNTVRIFNVIQIALNVYFFIEVVYHGWMRYQFVCEPYRKSDDDPHALRMKELCYYYYLLKLSDHVDTVFFVLRKKTRQISYLHLIHHFGMPIISYLCVRYFPGGHITFTGLLNTFVHAVMYLYYFVTSLGPEYKKYLWWKKYLTLLQMFQFLLIFLHLIAGLFHTGCDLPIMIVFYYMCNTMFMTLMFASFYHRTYIKKKTS